MTMRTGTLIAVFPVLLAMASLPVLAKKKAVEPAAPVAVTLPAGDDLYPGGEGASLADKNCLGCHSADMVLNQPALPDGTWLTEIKKMQSAYKAPIPDEDIAPLAAYLANQQGVNRSRWR
jgi:mono/diheme cytochrome c family protein